MTMMTKAAASHLVQDAARQLGVELAPDTAGEAAATLAASLRHVEGHGFVAVGPAGEILPTPAGEFVLQVVRAVPSSPIKPAIVAAAEPDQSGLNRTQRAVALIKARDPAATKAADAETLVARFGNPWRTGNRTHAAFVMRGNPALAERLKMEAK